MTVCGASAPTSTSGWSTWGTNVVLVVTDDSVLEPARALVVRRLAEVDVAASRFRADSEVSRLAGADDGSARVSPLLAELVAAGLFAALTTDGAVDPTLGADLVGLGYDRDLPAARAVAASRTVRGVQVRRRSAGWRDVRLVGDRLTVPPGTLLDLGATAKAWAADRCAVEVATTWGCGVLVGLGGDIRVAGPPPAAGWNVRVADGDDEPVSDVRLDGLDALATSSTLHRIWRTGADRWHHILDPRSGRSAAPVWRTVSVAAPTCVEANTLTTAAIVWGASAPDVLRASGRPARLVAADGSVHRLGGWPT